jgi:hypothetical protein
MLRYKRGTIPNIVCFVQRKSYNVMQQIPKHVPFDIDVLYYNKLYLSLKRIMI